MPEYYKTSKGYCYKKTQKGASRISEEDYKKAMVKKKNLKKTKNIKQKGGNGTLDDITFKQISDNVKLPLLKTFLSIFSGSREEPFKYSKSDNKYYVYHGGDNIEVGNEIFDIVDDDSLLEKMYTTMITTLSQLFQRREYNVRKKIENNVRERPMGDNKVILKKDVDGDDIGTDPDYEYNVYTSINNSNAKIIIDTDKYQFIYRFKIDNKRYFINIFTPGYLVIEISKDMEKLIEEILKKKGILQTPPPSPFLPRITTPHTADLSLADIEALGKPALSSGVIARVRGEKRRMNAARRAAERTRPPLSRQLEEQAAQQRAAAEEAARQAHAAAIEDAQFGEGQGGGKRKTKSKKSKKTKK